MGIDTAEKRRSATAFLLFTVLPIPDATINKGDRVHVTAIYRGLFGAAISLFATDAFSVSDIAQRQISLFRVAQDQVQFAESLSSILVPRPRPVQVIPEGPWLVAGRTKMMLGIRVMKTWNPTTKQFETMIRPSITEGTNGGKRFYGGPSKLI